MFNSFNTYSVFIRPDADEPTSTAVFVREGFNLWAFVFTLFWAAYHGIWRVVMLFIGVFFLLGAAQAEGLSPMMQNIIQLGMSLWIAFDAADWRGFQLKKKGYVLHDVVRAPDEEEALLRLAEREGVLA